MKKTLFSVPKMDCPSEEQAIRLAFDGNSSIKQLNFSLPQRQLEILHLNSPDEVLSVLSPLGFGAKIQKTEVVNDVEELLNTFSQTTDGQEKSALKKVFIINGVMFATEIGFGIYAQSTGLIADSLDMFADAAVFALSLYAVGKSIFLKKRAARISGYFQMTLALGALAEVFRRTIVGSNPEGNLMICVAAVALIANAFSMWILSSHRKGEVHMRASWIFLSNDVIANSGVIVAGLLVMATGTHVPDLIIGTLIAGIVFWGSLRILKTSK